MPKRKNAPKMPPASVEDRRDRNLRVVHREEMSTTIGDVLEHEHTDAAIELLYAQDNLAAGRDLNDPAALGVVESADAGQVDAAKVDAAKVDVGSEDTRPVDSAPPAADHAKSGTVVDNVVAGVVSEASAVVSEASAAATAVKAAASHITDTVAHAVTDAQTVARAHDENAAEARAQRRAAEVADTAQVVDVDEGKPLSKGTDLLRFLSPRFVVGATKKAVHEIVDGVREARSTLLKAGERARACFGPVRS